jgi:putative FmdB family regulatory protein
MPVYEYLCSSCGGRFEITQLMSDAPVDDCAECGGKMRRIISGGSGFILKSPDSQGAVRTHCGKTRTCCGSKTPCETPSCKSR